jgi:FtsP/CotA-like multicopper oxidase with cupredoxin domain
MTVVEADGNYVEPFETKNLYINSGETYKSRSKFFKKLLDHYKRG